MSEITIDLLELEEGKWYKYHTSFKVVDGKVILHNPQIEEKSFEDNKKAFELLNKISK